MERRVWLVVGDDRRELALGACPRPWPDDILPERRNASEYLGRLIGNPVMMDRLRAMLRAADGTNLLDRRNDRQIVEEVSYRIGLQRMCLERRPLRLREWPAPNTVTSSPSREPPPQQRAPSQTPSSSQAEPTQEELIDQDNQASVLESAALDGKPFCEECERQHQRETVGQAQTGNNPAANPAAPGGGSNPA